MTSIPWLSARHPELFPDPERALSEPNGLLAAGGDLSQRRLLAAYRRGIFPWYSEGEPILWWSPHPRAVLFPDELKISRSLRKTLKKQLFSVRLDHDFAAVIHACAAPRLGASGTWITAELQQAYCQLHENGFAHSVECWQAGELVGGLYGVAIGRVFFGESMFSRATDASKVALVYLTKQLKRWDFQLIDCQVSSAHLRSLGARDIPRSEFGSLLSRWTTSPPRPGPWRLDTDMTSDALA
jgi:leucyl/phenylalanyl-tRNA--protein transferase